MDLKSLSFFVFLGFLAFFWPSTSAGSTISPITNGTSSTLAPTTATPSPTCEALNSSCGSCTDDEKCYWCSSDSTCKDYPASKIVPRDCKGNKWYWKQCFAPGYVIIIVVPSICGVLLIAFGCCIYCCCCRSKRGSSGYEKETKRIKRRREDARQRSEARRADRKNRTDAIRQKYGLLNNEDDNEVV